MFETQLYCHNSGSLTEVNIGLMTLWFSYGSVIGFRYAGESVVVTSQSYSNTTSKHQNLIDPEKRYRISPSDFSERLEYYLKGAFKHLEN